MLTEWIVGGWWLLQLEEEKEEITKAVQRHSAVFAGNTLKESSMLKKSWIQKRKKERAAEKQVSDSQATRQVKHGEMTQMAHGETWNGGRRFRCSSYFFSSSSVRSTDMIQGKLNKSSLSCTTVPVTVVG